MAQYASRASVNLHTHIFFRNQKRDETGYVLFVRQNAVQVSVFSQFCENILTKELRRRRKWNSQELMGLHWVHLFVLLKFYSQQLSFTGPLVP